MSLCCYCTKYIENCEEKGIRPQLFLEIDQGSYVIYCRSFDPSEKAKRSAIDG